MENVYLELMLRRFLEHDAVKFTLLHRLLQIVNHPCDFYRKTTFHFGCKYLQIKK